MLIINADDFGRLESINEAIEYGFAHKILDRTTIMVTEPWVTDAINRAKKNDFFHKVGLHLNLDQGRPLTEDIKNIDVFCDNDGNFNARFQNSIGTKLTFRDQRIKQACRCEIEAQIQKYVSWGFPLMHIDSHHHVHTDFSILSLLIPIAKEYGFKSMRISNNLMKNSPLKSLYKFYINNLIRRHFESTHYFGNYYQCQNKLTGDVEVMVHPDMVDGIPVDLYNKAHNQYYCLDSILSLR